MLLALIFSLLVVVVARAKASTYDIVSTNIQKTCDRKFSRLIVADVGTISGSNDAMLVPRGGSREGILADNGDGSIQLEDQETHEEIMEKAATLRKKGKDLHDSGEWAKAAQLFQEASMVLSGSNQQSQDFCTCKLHEALCYLKNHNFEACVEVCSDLLQLDTPTVNTAIRARALHRRAKAYLQLGKGEEALEDARSAAFLGDRKAVALYGKLMRRNDHSHSYDSTPPPMLQDLLAGNSPIFKLGQETTNPLVESLWNKSSPNDPADTPSLLGRGGPGGTFVTSLISSLIKRLESDSEGICQFLQRLDPVQLQSMAQMAGLPLKEQQAHMLVKFCHSLRPQRIKQSVKLVKRLWYVIGVARKAAKLMQKYKHLCIMVLTIIWIRSAIRRPLLPTVAATREAVRATVAEAVGTAGS